MRASSASGLVFLKLGGSLLGDKRKPRSFRRSVVERLGGEITRAMRKAAGMRILLAHGGGAPAHVPAKRFRTREGQRGGGGWRGFSETRRGVAEMSRKVLTALARAELFPILVSPGAGVIAENGIIREWNPAVIRTALSNGRIPMIHGDAVLDRKRAFTVLSTEELFLFLSARLRPKRVVLACDVPGVYLGNRSRARHPPVVRVVDRSNLAEVRKALARSSRRLGRSSGSDVTGGMMAKVERLYELVRRSRDVEARIVSGLVPGEVETALLGGDVGTLVRYG